MWIFGAFTKLFICLRQFRYFRRITRSKRLIKFKGERKIFSITATKISGYLKVIFINSKKLQFNGQEIKQVFCFSDRDKKQDLLNWRERERATSNKKTSVLIAIYLGKF